MAGKELVGLVANKNNCLKLYYNRYHAISRRASSHEKRGSKRKQQGYFVS
jgi:hypothetical protein